jgi:hypothetical protein
MAIEISYDGDTFTYPNLSLTAELPFGFDGSDVRRGRTAEMLKVTGLLMRADAESLIDLYRAWRTDKLPEEDPEKSGQQGAVVLVSGEDVGFNWTNKPCWFSKAPDIAYAGIYAKVSVELVDAAQALEIMMEEKEDAEEDGIDHGTLTLNGAVITLKTYPNTYTSLPQLERNPAGAHVISGALTLVEVKEIDGWVSSTHLPLLTSWLNTTIGTTPVANAWFPVSWTKPKAEVRKTGLTYDVQFQLIKIIG